MKAGVDRGEKNIFTLWFVISSWRIESHATLASAWNAQGKARCPALMTTVGLGNWWPNNIFSMDRKGIMHWPTVPCCRIWAAGRQLMYRLMCSTTSLLYSVVALAVQSTVETPGVVRAGKYPWHVPGGGG